MTDDRRCTEQACRSVTDRTLVLGLVAFSLALRLIAVGTELNPTFHPALNTVLFVHDLLRERGIVGIVEHWKSLFSSTQEFSYVQRSAVAFPISAAVQRVLGPSLSLPALVGALHSTVGVVLAWVIGRSCGGISGGASSVQFEAAEPGGALMIVERSVCLSVTFEKAIADDEAIDFGRHEAAIGVFDRVDDRLAANVERGIDDDRASRELVELLDDVVEERVGLAFDRLDPRGIIDVGDSRNL